MQIRDIDNVQESSVSIEGKTWEDEDIRRLWSKNELIFRRLADFCRPLIITGKQCMDYALGKVFDPSTRAIYEKIQKKICIEPRILKSRINSIVGQLMRARRSGKITSEGSNDANEIFLANAVLKFFSKEIEEQYILTRMLFDGCLTGYPQTTIFEQAEASYGDPIAGLIAETLRWDSTVMNKLDKPDGSDLTDLIWIVRKTKSELIDENPDREEEIKEHFNYIHRSEGYGAGNYLRDTPGLTIEDARYLDYDVMTGIANSRIDGRLLCIQRLCVQKVETEVAISSNADSDIIDYQLIPPRWSKRRVNEWKREHPEYSYRKEKVKMLWRLRWTSDGLFLRNEHHWFQESDSKGNPVFPAAVFVPQIIDGIPTGPGPDDRLLVLMKAIAETEFLHDVRTGSGDIFAYKQGSVINHEDLPTELSIGQGIVQLDPEIVTGPIDESVAFLKRTPNTTYGDYSERVDQQLDTTDLISPSVRGQTAPDRKSAKSQGLEVAATVVGYSIVAENMNRTSERLRNLQCMMIPYVFTEEQLFQVYDDDRNETLSVTVNETEQGKNTGDSARIVANDLSSVKWRYRLTEGDDSPTAKDAELNEMLIFWNTTAPVLIDADETLMTLASVLMSMSNKTGHKLGQVIAEKAQVQAKVMSQQQMMQMMAELQEKKSKSESEMLKAKRSGFSFSITPNDLNQIPGVYKMLVDSQYINPQSGMFQNPTADVVDAGGTPGGNV